MRRHIGCATALMLLIWPAVGVTQNIDLVKIKPLLVESVEELRSVLRKSELTMSEYRDLLQIGCNTLTSLSIDADFASLLREYESRQYDMALERDLRDIFLDFRSFLEFLAIEQKLLLDAGLSEADVDDILGQLMKVRQEAAGFKLEAEALLVDLRLFEEQICGASKRVSDDVEQAELWCNVGRITTFVFGAAVTVVDGGAFLVPTLITQAAAGASMAGGAVLMGAAAMMPQC